MSDAQRWLLLVFSGVFGLLLGSFLNVVIFRLPRQCLSIWRQARSRCPRCRALIAGYDNLPVVSWLILRGRCRSCRAPISGRYVAVELLTGVLVAWLAHAQLWPSGLPAGLQAYAPADSFQRSLLWAAQVYVTASLVAASFIDFEFRILPTEINYLGAGLGLAACTIFPFLHLGAQSEALIEVLGGADPGPWARAGAAFAVSLLGLTVGAALTKAIAVVGTAVFRKDAMGMGDVKLMAFLGSWMGWRATLLLFVLGCFFGSLYGVLQWPFSRKLRGVEIWFGPFLAIGALLMLFAGGAVNRLLDAYIALFRVEGP